MATIHTTTEVCLDDYLCTGGFGDGDDGVALGVGWNERHYALKILNAELKKKKSCCRVVECSPGTLHNPCLIEIRPGAADVSLSDLEVMNGEIVRWDEKELQKPEFRKLQRAYKVAYNKFEGYLKKNYKGLGQ